MNEAVRPLALCALALALGGCAGGDDDDGDGTDTQTSIGESSDIERFVRCQSGPVDLANGVAPQENETNDSLKPTLKISCLGGSFGGCW